jgi:hypothetical protein
MRVSNRMAPHECHMPAKGKRPRQQTTPDYAMALPKGRTRNGMRPVQVDPALVGLAPQVLRKVENLQGTVFM